MICRKTSKKFGVSLICRRILVILGLVLWASNVQGGDILLGFANSDGSYDSYNLRNGQVSLGFPNPDGSQDTYNLKTDETKLGFINPDRSQDDYSLGDETPKLIK